MISLMPSFSYVLLSMVIVCLLVGDTHMGDISYCYRFVFSKYVSAEPLVNVILQSQHPCLPIDYSCDIFRNTAVNGI